MALNAKEATGGGGFNQENLEPGTYPARIVAIVDLGLQPQSYQGEQKDPRQMMAVTYEFLDEFLKDEDGQEQTDKPRWLTERFPLFNIDADRAKSTIRIKAIDPNLGKSDGDWSKLLGEPVMVTVVLNPGKGKNADRIYENIAAVSAMRAKDAEKAGDMVNVPYIFDLDDPDLDIFLALPKFLREKIQSNLQWESSALAKLLNQKGEPAKEDAPEGTTKHEDLEGEAPF